MSSREVDEPGRRRSWLIFVRDIVVIVLIAVLVSGLVKTFLVRSFYIPSGSMLNTLQLDDRILVNELQPRPFSIERGDIVVFSDPGSWLPTRPESPVNPVEWLLSFVGLVPSDSDEHLVKRVIGMPGDHVVCCDDIGHLVINGEPITEPYLRNTAPPASVQTFDVTVPEDSIWVMGDNREQSADSRSHTDGPGGGFVPMDNVVGRAFLRMWPLSTFGLLESPSDVFSAVPDPQ